MRLLIVFIFVLSIFSSSFAYWTPEVRISGPGPCWEPRIIASGDTLHVIYVNDNGPERIDYLRSTDRGRTWTSDRMLSDTINTYNAYFPQILVYGQKILVVWWAIFDIGPYQYNLGYARSTNGGSTWSAPAYIFGHNKINLLPFAMANHDSLINLIYGEYNDTVYIFSNIRSINFGSNWQQPAEVFRAGNSDRYDMTSDGDNFYYAWGGARYDTSTYHYVYFLKSSDDGNTWSDLVPISPIDEYLSRSPALSSNGQGDVVFSWTYWIHSQNWFTADIFIRISSDYGNNWSEPLQISYDHLEEFSNIFWDSSNLHVVWQKYTNRNMVIYRSSTDNGLTWGNETWLDQDTSSSMKPHIAANENKVYAIWVNIDSDTGGVIGTYFSRYLPYISGDANNSGDVNGLDVVYLVNYFKGIGPEPEQFYSGDANGNCLLNGIDVIYLVNYLKGIGLAPIYGNCP